MTGLIIATVIIVVIPALLMSSLTITLVICDRITFKVGFLGFSIYKLKPKNKNKSVSVAGANKAKSTNKLTSLLKEYTKGKSKSETVYQILEILKNLCLKFTRLLKHVRFKRLKLSLGVATDNAANTAIIYGNICAVVYSICGMLKSSYNFDPKKIRVYADFSSEHMSLVLDSKIKIRLIFVISFLISTIFSLFKIKLGEVKNGRA